MGRKNKRRKTEYRTRLGFNPWKYITTTPAHPEPRRYQTGYRTGKRTPQRGDIWFADLNLHSGTSVQGGCRPVLVISNDIGNTYAETLNVLPMTSQLKKPDLPCHTKLDPEIISDKQQKMDASMILAEQITTISKDQLRNYVGRVEEKELIAAVDQAVSMQLGLLPVSLVSDHHFERSANI